MIVITGLRAEARIASAPGVSVFACNGNVGRRAHAIKRAVSAGAPAILSFGIAGGLSSHLMAGDWVVATGVMSGGRRIETDIEWSSRVAERLSGAELGDIAVGCARPAKRAADDVHRPALVVEPAARPVAGESVARDGSVRDGGVALLGGQRHREVVGDGRALDP